MLQNCLRWQNECQIRVCSAPPKTQNRNLFSLTIDFFLTIFCGTLIASAENFAYFITNRRGNHWIMPSGKTRWDNPNPYPQKSVEICNKSLD